MAGLPKSGPVFVPFIVTSLTTKSPNPHEFLTFIFASGKAFKWRSKNFCASALPLEATGCVLSLHSLVSVMMPVKSAALFFSMAPYIVLTRPTFFVSASSPLAVTFWAVAASVGMAGAFIGEIPIWDIIVPLSQ